MVLLPPEAIGPMLLHVKDEDVWLDGVVLADW